MRTKTLTLILLVSPALIFLVGAESPGANQDGSPEASKRNQDAVLKELLPVIYSSRKPIRLYYRSACRAATDPSNDAVPFPSVRVKQPSKQKTGLDAVREIFSDDRNVSVAEDSNGIIRIWIGNVPTAILQTKISSIRLGPNGQYNPDEVFDAIMKTKEMEAAMRSLRFSSVWNPSSTRAEPDDKYPHLSARIESMTAEQVLDKIAKTWAGGIVVIYGACAEPRESDGLRQFWLGIAGQY